MTSRLLSVFLTLIPAISVLHAAEMPPQARRALDIFEAQQQRAAAGREGANFRRDRRGSKSWAPDLEALRFDVRHYDLRLFVDIGREYVSGSVTVDLVNLEEGLDSLELDADANLGIFDVSLLADSRFSMDSSRSLSFSHDGERLLIHAPQALEAGEELKILISYGGHAYRDGYGINWDEHGNGRPLAWTMAEPFGARVWWPCQDRPDDKATFSLEVTTDARWTVASNGVEVSRTILPGARLARSCFASRWEVASYLVVMNISDFDYSEREYIGLDGTSMPVVLYALPEVAEQAQTDLARTPEMISVLASRYGEYPFLDEKYGNCSTYLGGGMEHQTLTTFGVSSLGTDFMPWLDVHELGHQWWGDWLTCADWRELWLNEGFATYTEWVWAEHLGEDVLRDYLEDTDAIGLFFGPVYDNPVPFSNTVYNKGGWILRMLRHRLGDDVFWAAIRAYRAEYGGRTALTSQLQEVFEETSGTDLGFFFDQWVYGENRPKVLYDWEELDSGELRITLRQVQSNAPPFRFLLDVRALRTGGGVEEHQIEVQALREQTLEVTTGGGIGDIIPDPDHQLLAEFAPASGPMIDFGEGFPGPWEFGTLSMGSSETTRQVLHFRNVGGAPVSIMGCGFYNPMVSDFGISLPAELPIVVNPGESVDIDLSFRALGMGSRDNWLFIATDDPREAVSYIRLHGTAGFFEGPHLQHGSRLAFGEVKAGAFVNGGLEISNLGSKELQIVASLDSEVFRLNGVGEFNLAAGEHGRIGVSFQPPAPGEYEDRLVLLSNDPQQHRVEVPLSGRAVAAPAIEAVPSMVDFGVAPAGSIEEFRINSIGSAPLHVEAVEFDGEFRLADVPGEVCESSRMIRPGHG